MINSSLKLVCLQNLPSPQSGPQSSSSIKDYVRVREQSLPKELLGDKIRLKQVLINLTKYALKQTHNG